MDDSYEEQFKGLTKGMELEKIYDALAERVEFVRVLSMHCGEIYKTARGAGLPRGVAERMTMDYFTYEVTPAGIYTIESQG